MSQFVMIKHLQAVIIHTETQLSDQNCKMLGLGPNSMIELPHALTIGRIYPGPIKKPLNLRGGLRFDYALYFGVFLQDQELISISLYCEAN